MLKIIWAYAHLNFIMRIPYLKRWSLYYWGGFGLLCKRISVSAVVTRCRSKMHMRFHMISHPHKWAVVCLSWALFPILIPLFHVWDSHYKYRIIMRLSYFYNGNLYNGKMKSVYWDSPLIVLHLKFTLFLNSWLSRGRIVLFVHPELNHNRGVCILLRMYYTCGSGAVFSMIG